MAIKFKHRGESITVDTPEEAAKLMALLRQQDTEEARHAWGGAHLEHGGVVDLQASADLRTPWAPDVFLRFVERLGAQQRKALSMLVTHRTATDQELRDALGVSGNQALAGVLSGVSKQAAALGIRARDIFRFENLRTAGKRRSTYTIADKFLQIAMEMGWPSGSQE